MTRFPTLYKRASTGKIQAWTIEVEEDKYRTITGINKGKMVISEWTICKGKNLGKSNETSPADQAFKEAEAAFKKKYEKNYFKDIEEVDNLDFKSPMLAKDYKDYADEVELPAFAQPKLDGVRCVVSKDRMFSRNNKDFVSCPHIREDLDELFKAFPDIEFDGELYNDAYKHDFDALISLIRKTKPTKDDLREAAEKVQYWMYDIRDPDNIFEDRSNRLREFFNKYELSDSLVFVETVKVNSEEEIDAFYNKCRAAGKEGAIIRQNTKYLFKRTSNLLRIKEGQTIELLILEVIEGVGNRAGMAGKLRFEIDGKTFYADIIGGHDYYRELWLNRGDYEGKKYATIWFQNYTPKGIPRFPKVQAIRDYE